MSMEPQQASTPFSPEDSATQDAASSSSDSFRNPVKLRSKLVEEEPRGFWYEFNRATNILVSSSLVAALRTYMNPPAPPAPPEPGAHGVPEWFSSEYMDRELRRLMTQRFLKDTAAFAAAAYLLDGVEKSMQYFRGKEDPMNRVMGGVAAGGLLSFAWYPGNPRARALVTCTGAVVGYWSFKMEEGAKVVLLEKQRELEKELLHKPEPEIKKELNQFYLKQLLLIKQQQGQQERRQQLQHMRDELKQQPLHQKPGQGGDISAYEGLRDEEAKGEAAFADWGSDITDEPVLVITDEVETPPQG